MEVVLTTLHVTITSPATSCSHFPRLGLVSKCSNASNPLRIVPQEEFLSLPRCKWKPDCKLDRILSHQMAFHPLKYKCDFRGVVSVYANGTLQLGEVHMEHRHSDMPWSHIELL